MNFRALVEFLRDLDDHNDTSWMDEHRDYYNSLREDFTAWVGQLDERLQGTGGYTPTDPEDAVEQMNHNLLHHPDYPPYKTYVGAELGKAKGRPAFYVRVGLKNSMVAGGYHNPPSDVLKQIRAAIDERGDELVEILEEDRFRKTYGELEDENALKTAPRGYDQDHEHIELLRLKSFAVSRKLTQEEAMSDDFVDQLVRDHEVLAPFNDWLAGAVGG